MRDEHPFEIKAAVLWDGTQECYDANKDILGAAGFVVGDPYIDASGKNKGLHLAHHAKDGAGVDYVDLLARPGRWIVKGDDGEWRWLTDAQHAVLDS